MFTLMSSRYTDGQTCIRQWIITGKSNSAILCSWHKRWLIAWPTYTCIVCSLLGQAKLKHRLTWCFEKAIQTLRPWTSLKSLSTGWKRGVGLKQSHTCSHMCLPILARIVGNICWFYSKTQSLKIPRSLPTEATCPPEFICSVHPFCKVLVLSDQN